ncbi:MAG: 4'-phosphopantetheinyl transferase superfamily protein [Bdellovibrionales bacterium]
MAAELQHLITEARAICPDLRAECHPEWGASQPGYREQIRDSLARSLPALGREERHSLANLSAPPRVSNWSISISHCQSHGAWVAVPRPWKIGFDLEQTKRLRRPLIERISTAEERQSAGRAEWLWVAKEAYFKALENEQPLTFAQLRIGDWSRAQGVFRCQGLSASGSSVGLGFVLDGAEVTCCLFLIHGLDGPSGVSRYVSV